MVIMHEWKEKGSLKEKRMRRWTEEGKGVKEGSEKNDTRENRNRGERAMRRQKYIREEEEDEGNQEIDQTES